MRFSWGWSTIAAFAVWRTVMWFGTPGASPLILPMVHTGLGWLMFAVVLGLSLRAIDDWKAPFRHVLGVSWVLLSLLWLFSAVVLIFQTIEVDRYDQPGGAWAEIRTRDFGPPEGAPDQFLYRCWLYGLWCQRCDARAMYFSEAAPWRLEEGGIVWDQAPPPGCEAPSADGR